MLLDRLIIDPKAALLRETEDKISYASGEIEVNDDHRITIKQSGFKSFKLVPSCTLFKGKIVQNGFSSFKLVPSVGGGDFEDRFDDMFNDAIGNVTDRLDDINREANAIKDRVLEMSDNFKEEYLSKAEFDDGIDEIVSGIVEGTATFVTKEEAGQWYGLHLTTDVNGKKYITGFDMGALVNPNAGTSDSYFRINADRFIVGGDIGDGKFGSGVYNEYGEEVPAFSIVQKDGEIPQLYFNGKMNIQALPQSVNKFIGSFSSELSLASYLSANPEIVLSSGDSYFNTTEKIVYIWDGAEWISSEGRTEYKSIVFKRSNTKPNVPTGGTYNNPVPIGWSDGIPNMINPLDSAEAAVPIWSSYCIFDNKNSVVPVWSDPVIMADSATMDFMYNSSLTTPELPKNFSDSTEVSAEDASRGWYNTATSASVWQAVRTKSHGVWSFWQIIRIKGESGKDGVDGGRGSSILSGSATTPSGFTSAFISAFGNVLQGDQYISTSSSGTYIWTYRYGVWTDNVALRVNGDAIINGTLSADKLASNALYGKLVQFDSTGALSTVTFTDNIWGTSNTAYSFSTNNRTIGLYSVKTNSGNGSAIYGRCSSSNQTGAAVVGNNESYSADSFGGYFISKGGYGAVCMTAATTRSAVLGTGPVSSGYLGYGTYGVYTPQNAYIGGTTYPFTGSHIVLKLDECVSGDIIVVNETIDVYDVNTSIVSCKVANSGNDKRVFGVFNGVEMEIEDAFNGVLNLTSPDPLTPAEPNTHLYNKLKDISNYAIGVNAIGEGGINVCSINGNIESGDYIVSSSVPGKGMKQEDDIFRSCTVAKALDNVNWDEEIIGDTCQELDGYKWKMIACTYHCG